MRSGTRLATALLLALSVARPAAAVTPASSAAAWLAKKVGPGGYVAALDGKADPGTTVTIGLALAAAGNYRGTIDRIATYLSAHVDEYATSNGKDRPGALGRLAMLASVAGRDPNAFGTGASGHLIDRILATRTLAGPYAGLLADPLYNGTFNHALGLLGVATARTLTADQQLAATSALDYLVAQQCPDGGWQNAPRVVLLGTALTACGTGQNGPDTNADSMATQALAAFHRTATVDPLTWWDAAQNTAGGYGYLPGGATDSDSTALAVQAILAAGGSPTSARFTAKRTVYSALLALQIANGADRGAFAYMPAADGTLRPNVYSTSEALPAVTRRVFPLPHPN